MKLIGYIIVCALLYSCGTTETSPEAIAAQNKRLSQIESQLKENGLEIEFDWARPTSGSQVNLISNPNGLEIKGDTIIAYLPYFGVRQIADYNGEGGIKFTSVAENKVIANNEDKGALAIQFNVSDTREQFQFNLTIFGNGKCLLNVNSSERDFIQYQGRVLNKK
ncbi:DUF4251 domain-containing protein [Cochleicola gelatinilyticus]|uniref:DUF4251 domain-containing protein n=1 Tax=Cochleicola gelatinilyticus TaxID=1763537 RepID=A0A167GWS9_9FLAO|nr:DUF4251 domain-containing protein [Cochleicola gelatinilyticus]OAB77986.1 hypothetical protein ULVI_10885 [Cochleicola gelatinilyticus]